MVWVKTKICKNTTDLPNISECLMFFLMIKDPKKQDFLC